MSLRPWLALLASFLVASGCSKKHQDEPSALVDQAWSPYLESVTDGDISRKGPVRLRFVHPMVDSSEVGKEFQGELTMEPAIAGKMSWESTQDLVLRPSSDLEQGRQYLGRLSSKGLKGLPSDLAEFVFKFSVMRQGFELEWNGFTSVEGADSTRYTLDGLLKTTDVSDSGQLTSFLKASQGGKTLSVTWTVDPQCTRHLVHLGGVIRGKSRSSAKVTLHPAAIDMDAPDQENSLAIPALGEFDLLFCKPLEGASQGIQLQFTDPLASGIDLAALIHVDGQSPLRFETKGPRVEAFLPRVVAGTVVVHIDSRMANLRGVKLGRDIRREVEFKVQEPGAKFLGSGIILPEADQLLVPLEATSVSEVTVEAFQVYASNMGQFLQVNTLDGTNESRRVGRYLWRKHLKLATDSTKGPLRWTRYAIDVTDLLKEHRGSLFRLSLKIDRSHSIYPCPGDSQSKEPQEDRALDNWESNQTRESSGWDGWSESWEGNGEGESVNGEPASIPGACTEAYFHKNKPGEIRERNLIASDLGLLAKAGSDGILHLVATSLRTGEPSSGVEVTAYNFQNQPLGKTSTGSDGMATLNPPTDAGFPFYLKAQKGDDIGYLKVSSGAALPITHFETGGLHQEEGLKGAWFGERGVWRPGDSLYLAALFEDRAKILPKGHPMRFELRDPAGRLVAKQATTWDGSGFHLFRTATTGDAPTGTWTVTARIGDRSFSKPLSIETVKPNRIDIKLKWDSDTLRESDLTGTLKAQWMHGGSAAGLKAKIRATTTALPLRFDRFAKHVFEDPRRSLGNEPSTIFEGAIGSDGSAAISSSLSLENPPSSAVQLHFATEVTEPAGDASISRTESVWLPYSRYLGLLIPEGDHARDMLRTDTTHKLQVVVLDNHGKPAKAGTVRATVTKMNWDWWYESGENNQAQYRRTEFGTPMIDTTLDLSKGVATWPLRIRYPEWGRYLLRVCDAPEGEETPSGHCAGKVVFIDWPGWAGRPKEQVGPGASILTLAADQPGYAVGQTANLTFTSPGPGRALVSLETGTQILKTFWVESKPGQNRVQIPLDASMSPVVYAHVSLIQPHLGRKNDLPLRLYGILPISVDDPSSRLQPVLTAPAEMRPNQNLSLTVRESGGHPMTYTVAVVDEGLLSLTGHTTPDPRKVFRQKDALGVRTWDLFDWVVGAWGGQLERILSIGGDAAGKSGLNDPGKPNRFPPLVRYIGPFQLGAGKTANHTLAIPEYVGKVRVMVLAGSTGAWGSTEAQVFIRKPLMLLPSVPRVARPGEELELAATVFAMKDRLGKIQVNLDPGTATLLDGASRSLSLPVAGEGMARFRVKIPASARAVQLRFHAAGGGETADQEVSLPILVAGTAQATSQSAGLEPGKSWESTLDPKGIEGTGQAWLEISPFPRLSASSSLASLIGYPHGCLEQTTSKAFPQMLLGDLVDLSDEQRLQIRGNVQVAIQKIAGFQASSGAFGYWPGQSENDWANLWAGHFLLEAQIRHFEVPTELLSTWKTRQKQVAGVWWSPASPGSVQIQAYRLFLLALANSPDLAAMNRLRGAADRVPASAKSLLAGAYALAGQGQAALELTRNRGLSQTYLEPGETFGSSLRDEAVSVYAMARQGKTKEATIPALALADSLLKPESVHNTQSLAWSLLAVTAAFNAPGEEWVAKVTVAGKPSEIRTRKPLVRLDVPLDPKARTARVKVTNDNKRALTLRWTTRSVPESGQEREESSGLGANVRYSSLDSVAINPLKLTQGTDLLATVVVSNSTYRHLRNLALTYVVPSGWEIRSGRLDQSKRSGSITYQDIRDDRVMAYFDLGPNQNLEIPIRLHATWPGTYQLPGLVVESMYESAIQARTKGQTAVVVR